MMHEDRYPTVPGHRGVDTSIDAAASVAQHLGYLQAKVYRAILAAGTAGLTTNEVADHLNIERGSIQPRTSELRAKRKIRDSGHRRPNANGKKAIVWVVVGEGH